MMSLKNISMRKKPKRQLGLFLCLLSFMLCFLICRSADALSAPVSNPKVIEELSDQEKKKMAAEWLHEGDALFEAKDYNRASAAYEQVFLFDPNNQAASKRLDRLKKKLMKEGKMESQVVGGVYDSEIESRSRTYWAQAQEFVESGKVGQARLTLEKLLLINPLHKEARKLYQSLQSELEADS